MEYELNQEGNYLKRVHFHLMGVNRDAIEESWSRGRGKIKIAWLCEYKKNKTKWRFWT